MKKLMDDIEKRVDAVEKSREQRKVWIRPAGMTASSENGIKQNGVEKDVTLQFEVTN